MDRGCSSVRRHRSPGTIAPVLATAAAACALVAACSGSEPGPSNAPPPAPGSAAASSSPSSPEVNPAGDIPDNQAYVPFPAPDGLFVVSVPEGWARSTDTGGTTFRDKLNAVRLESTVRDQPPTPASAQAQDLPELASNVPGYVPGRVSTTTRQAGPAVVITYRATSAPDLVTGRTTTDEVERYEFWHAGRQVNLTLSGPVGADNVDPWRMVTDSLRWQR